MGIFKEITEHYCQKILDTYLEETGKKLYPGHEAELVVQRNDFAKCFIKEIKEIEIKGDDYLHYFDQIIKDANAALKKVKEAVAEHNRELKKEFTTDLYESFFTVSLINFINAVRELYKRSEALTTEIKDPSEFCDKREIPWINQFSYVLYQYILNKEFDIATKKVERDIFNAKKEMILKYIHNAFSLYQRFEKKEDNEEYQKLMKLLLSSMVSEEKGIQRRKSDENSSGYMSYLSHSFYKASEKIIGKNLLGQKIDFLVTEFNERVATSGLAYT